MKNTVDCRVFAAAYAVTLAVAGISSSRCRRSSDALASDDDPGVVMSLFQVGKKKRGWRRKHIFVVL